MKKLFLLVVFILVGCGGGDGGDQISQNIFNGDGNEVNVNEGNSGTSTVDTDDNTQTDNSDDFSQVRADCLFCFMNPGDGVSDCTCLEENFGLTPFLCSQEGINGFGECA